MKRFYATVALLGAVVTGAFAQKTLDLQYTGLYPTQNQAFPNFNNGDSLYIGGIIKNLSTTESVLPTDTISIWFGGCFTNGTDAYSIGYTLNPVTIAPGASDTVVLKFKQGQVVNTQDNISVKFNTNSADTFTSWVYAVDGTGSYFIDAGYDDTDPDNPFGTSSNNVFARIVTFGSTAINDVNFKKSTLNIFPNPAGNQISFTNEFVATTIAIVKVTDVAGRVVKTMDLGKQNAGSKTYSVDISDLNNGMYYIELVTDDTRSISKFTKK